jgi:hypothetical protein
LGTNKYVNEAVVSDVFCARTWTGRFIHLATPKIFQFTDESYMRNISHHNNIAEDHGNPILGRKTGNYFDAYFWWSTHQMIAYCVAAA